MWHRWSELKGLTREGLCLSQIYLTGSRRRLTYPLTRYVKLMFWEILTIKNHKMSMPAGKNSRHGVLPIDNVGIAWLQGVVSEPLLRLFPQLRFSLKKTKHMQPMIKSMRDMAPFYLYEKLYIKTPLFLDRLNQIIETTNNSLDRTVLLIENSYITHTILSLWHSS